MWLAPLSAGVRARTVGAAVAVVGVALVVGGGLLLVLLQHSLTSSVEGAARQRATDVAGLVADDPANLDDALGRDRGSGHAPGQIGEPVVVQILGSAGRVRASSRALDGRPALPGARTQRPGSIGRLRLPGDDDPWALAVRDVPTGATHIRVVAAASLRGVEQTVHTTAIFLATGLPVLLALVGAVTWHTAGRSLAPVEAIRAQVMRITSGTLAERVPEPGTSDEVARLAGTMNAMLDRLERAHAAQRRFVADAGHELRSPLAALRSAVEVRMAGDGPTARLLLGEVDRLSSLVDDLLLLATADEAEPSPGDDDVDLDDLLAREARRLSASGTVTVAADLAPVRVRGDPRQMERVVRNLVANAARHARSRVWLACRADGPDAVVTVDDDGPGVAPADRARVFERFTRLDEARARDGGGSGLGLAIVREVVVAHGGTVTVTGRAAGAGLPPDAPTEESAPAGARFLVRLPLPPAP